MKITRNIFIKFLVDEILAKSNVGTKQAYEEVQEFSKTKEFKECYKKWRILQMRTLDHSNYNPMKPIQLILSGVYRGFNSSMNC